MVMLRLPPAKRGTEQEQIDELRRYLRQLTDELQWAFDHTEAPEKVDVAKMVREDTETIEAIAQHIRRINNTGG